METQTLREALPDWTDWDVAGYKLAQCLGLMSPKVDFPGGAKSVFWTDNPIGNMLHHILEELVEQGVLEKRDEPDDQYRWNSAFMGSWQ